MLYKTMHYTVIFTAIMLFVPTAFSQSCTTRDFGIPCNFAVDTPARFGDLNGKSFGSIENSHMKLTPDFTLGCRNIGSWRKDGISSNGQPFRSPCEKLGSLDLVGEIWLTNFHQDRIKGLISYKFQPIKNWDICFLEKPTTIYLNDLIRCHPNDDSLILVKGKDGSDYCDEDQTQPCFYAEVPAQFTRSGEDITANESIMAIIIVMCLFLLVLMCICSSDTNNEFTTGYIIGSLLSDCGDSSTSPWGGYSND